MHVSDRTRYSGVIGSAYYEAELKIKEFKMADLNEKLFDSDRTLGARVKKNESWRVLLQSHAYNSIRDSRRDSFFYAGSRATAAFGRNDFKITTMVVLCKNVETKRPNFFVARSCHLHATANNLEFEIKKLKFLKLFSSVRSVDLELRAWNNRYNIEKNRSFHGDRDHETTDTIF